MTPSIRNLNGRRAADLRRASRSALIDAQTVTRDSTLRILDSLEPAQYQVPYRPEINPPLWELGHVGWFHEQWCLRWRDGQVLRESMLPEADRWFDSSRIAHRLRWELPHRSSGPLRQYLVDVRDSALERLSKADEDDEGLYPHRLALFHEQMHLEAFAQTWQTLDWPMPPTDRCLPVALEPAGDTDLPGGEMELGSMPADGFVFDNEKWAHPVTIDAFGIALRPTTNAQYRRFVEAGGYDEPRWWDAGAFDALRRTGRVMPSRWRLSDGRWTCRWFGREIALEPDAPVLHVDAYEAQAWCRWAGRRLPTEAQWEFAATRSESFQWGSHVWEWTATPFGPYPGFSADRYHDYSLPWFGTHRVVRGGSFATPAGLLSPRFRNFYLPERHDVFAGFRSCSID